MRVGLVGLHDRSQSLRTAVHGGADQSGRLLTDLAGGIAQQHVDGHGERVLLRWSARPFLAAITCQRVHSPSANLRIRVREVLEKFRQSSLIKEVVKHLTAGSADCWVVVAQTTADRGSGGGASHHQRSQSRTAPMWSSEVLDNWPIVNSHSFDSRGTAPPTATEYRRDEQPGHAAAQQFVFAPTKRRSVRAAD
jgi:hypothetical protein